VPAEFGGAVALEGVFPAASGAYLDLFGTQITCRFGSVAVLGRRIDGARAECAAPSAAPGAKRVAVDGAAGAVALEQRLTLDGVAFRSPASTSYAKRDDVAETNDVVKDVKDAVPLSASFETHEVRLAHYAGGSDVFAGTRDFVRFELSLDLDSAASAFFPTTRCVFDDGASTRARFVSSVSGTCDVPIRAIARRSRDAASHSVSAVSRTSAGARDVVATRFALAFSRDPDPDGKDRSANASLRRVLRASPSRVLRAPPRTARRHRRSAFRRRHRRGYARDRVRPRLVRLDERADVRALFGVVPFRECRACFGEARRGRRRLRRRARLCLAGARAESRESRRQQSRR
jgi:hypothetical protein